MKAVEIDRRKDVGEVGRNNIKFGEQFDFASCNGRVDMKLSREGYEIFLQNLQRKHACARESKASVPLNPLLLDCDYLFDKCIFGEAFDRTLLVRAIDAASIRVKDGTILVEVVAEHAFGYDFFFVLFAAN